MRRALIVGIDEYMNAPLRGCVADARSIADVLARNDDGSPNFHCKKLIAPPTHVTKAHLKERIKELFSQPADIVVFYFAGHGIVNHLGGHLITPDVERDDGIPMLDILTVANSSRIHEIVIILDCCDSGAFGSIPTLHTGSDQVFLREGITVLTASRSSQSALEEDGRGVFTKLVCDALKGGAADILGNVTVASIYAFVDQLLGAWDQRPLFKSFVSKLSSLRKCRADIDLSILRLLPLYFPNSDYEFPLDPSYEIDKAISVQRDARKETILRHFQAYRDARLLLPIGEKHLYYAVLNSKSCSLTSLGRFYWKLVKDDRI